MAEIFKTGEEGQRQDRVTKIIKKSDYMDLQNRRRRTKAPTGKGGQRATFGCWSDC